MLYIQKTTFSNDILVDLVKDCIDTNQLLKDPSRLHLKNRANLAQQVDINDRKKKEVTRRITRAAELNGPRVTIFDQLSLPRNVEEKVLDTLPNEIIKYEPNITVQIIQGGVSCTPHRDHSRICSLFYLYTKPNVKTVWWEKTDDFEEFSDLRYADIDKIKPVNEEIIQKNCWYIFNNNEYHSIHAIGNAIIDRKTLVIEFDNITAEILMDILNEQRNTITDRISSSI